MYSYNSKSKELQDLVYYLELEKDSKLDKIVKKKIKAIAICENGDIQYILNPSKEFLKEIFENENIKKYGHNLTEDYIILKQEENNYYKYGTFYQRTTTLLTDASIKSA